MIAKISALITHFNLKKEGRWRDSLVAEINLRYPDYLINDGNGQIFLNARLSDQELINQIRNITALDRYQYQLAFTELDHERYRINQNSTYRAPNEIKTTSFFNDIKLREEQFKNTDADGVQKMVNEFLSQNGYRVEAELILFALSPDGYVFEKEEAQRKFRAGGMSLNQNTAFWTEKSMLFKPTNRITSNDYDRLTRILNKATGKSFVYTLPELEEPQLLKIYTMTDINEWTYKKGLQLLVSKMLKSDGNRGMTAETPQECEITTEYTGDYEQTGKEKSEKIRVYCNGEDRHTSTIYLRTQHHSFYGSSGVYEVVDFAADTYLAKTIDAAVKKVCDCQ